MGYDSKAVKISKSEKTLATLFFNKEIKRHMIREFVRVQEQSTRSRSSKNKTSKEDA